MGAGRQKRGGRRAIVIGGSMSGLFTAAFLRQIGWDADVYERSPVELVGRGAGITSHPELLRGARAERSRDAQPRHRRRQAHRHRPPGARHRRAPAQADPDVLGPAPEPVARDDPRRALSSRSHLRARRSGRQRGARPLRRGPHRARRPAGRRRRRQVRRARASRTGRAAHLRRLLHLARRPQRGRPGARDARQHLSPLHVLPSRAPAGHRLSDCRARQRSATRPSPLQFHLVPRRRCAAARGDVRRRATDASTSSRCRRRSSAKT